MIHTGELLLLVMGWKYNVDVVVFLDFQQYTRLHGIVDNLKVVMFFSIFSPDLLLLLLILMRSSTTSGGKTLPLVEEWCHGGLEVEKDVS